MADYSSGRVTVPVIPTLAGAQSTIAGAFDRLKPPTITPQIDTTGLTKQIKTVSKEKLDLDAAQINTKIEKVKEKLADLARQKASPRVDAEITAATARLDQVRARLRELESMEPSPKVNADIAQAQARVATITDQIQRLDAQRASPRVDAEITQARAQLDQFNAQLRGVDEQRAVADVDIDDGGGIARAGGRLDWLKDRAGTLGPAFATAGLAAGAALVAGIVAAVKVDDARAVLGVQLGLTAQDSERYGAIAGQLYGNAYGESLDDVNGALAAVTRNIGASATASDAVLGDVTAGVLNLSSAFGVDLNETTRAVGTMMKTGLAPDAKTALDVITVGLQSGVNVADDLFDTFSEYSTQFRKLGLDGVTATGLLSQGLKAGARDADTVADALKEFSIRAVDGSATTATAYQGLGLDAEKLTQQIAAGGPAAEAGLGTVLTKLRDVKDPALQAQLAVGLFGTKAEDLGAALYALDPSTAAAGLGQVAGAADQMNTALGETASARLQTFTRSLQTGLVDFIGGMVLPAISALGDAGSSMFGAAWEPIRSFLGFLAGSGGVVVGVILAIAGAVKLWAFATTTLNFAFLASPITWVIIGIVALIAVVIWAWNHFEGFRNIVLGAWSAISSATSTAGSIVGTVAGAIGTAISAVGGFFSWLWVTAVEPVLSAIGLALRILGAIIFVILVAPWVLAFNILSALFGWLYDVAIAPAFAKIASAAGVVGTVLSVIFGGIGSGLNILGGFFSWLYDVAIAPVFSGITVGGQLLRYALDVVFAGIRAGLSGLGQFFLMAYNVMVKPALDGWGIVGRAVWENVLRPAFDGIMAGVRAVGSAFEWAVGKIGDVWGRIQSIVRPPVEFVVNGVYNSGIRPAWNFIAGIFGLGSLPELRFARGGLVPGYAPGRDTVPAMLSPGEGILTPEAVKMLGPKTVLALNAASRRRGTRGGDIGYLGDRPGVQGFADGGIVGWLWDRVGDLGSFVGGVAEFITDPIGSVKRVFDSIATGGLGGAGQLSEGLMRFPGKVVDAAIRFVKGFIDREVGGGAWTGGGAGPAAGLAFAKSQSGKPYQWGGGGNPSWDCSGFIAGITRVIRGQSPGRIGTTANMPWPGFKPGLFGPFQVGNSGNTGGGIGHMAGTLLGQNVESAGGRAGVRVGGAARGARDGLFGQKYSLTFDNGGLLPRGDNWVRNDTGRPEAVLTARQWSAVERSAAGSDGGAFTGDLYLDSGEFLGAVRGVVRTENADLGTALSRGRR